MLYKYKALPTIEDVDITDYFIWPLSYFDKKLKKEIKINNKYPRKILGKYYLVNEIKSKDTLTIKTR